MEAGPPDVGDPPMPAVDQVLHGHVAAQHVVDGHRAQRVVALGAVDDDERGAAPGHGGEVVGVRVERGDEDALHPLLGRWSRYAASRSERLSLLHM